MFILQFIYELHHEKICLLSFQPGPTQIVQPNKIARGLKYWIKKLFYIAKTKALISCTVIAQPFPFVFTYAKSRISHDVAQISANREARTNGERQTPVHYAAKNDATSSLKMLIKMKCEYRTVLDYKGRSPLHVAAELGKLELLLDSTEPCCEKSGLWGFRPGPTQTRLYNHRR